MTPVDPRSVGKHALISEHASIRETFFRINEVSGSGGEPGIAVVLDDSRQVLGVVTDGDIRNAFCREIDLASSVSTIMSRKFVHVLNHLPPSEQLRSVLRQVGNFKRLNDPRLSKVVVVDDDRRFVDIVNLLELYRHGDISLRRIAVYGLGFVGLTLALTFAELRQFEVLGIDVSPDLIDRLRRGHPHFHEKGLKSLLESCLAQEAIRFLHADESYLADIHVISVGTPVSADRLPDFSFLEAAGRQIGARLKEGDLVICRSTVPVGTTRRKLIPILERCSELRAGRDFFVAFAPERTVEGNALRELRTIPQIVGGLTPQCRDQTLKLFQRINPTVIPVGGLEGAEVVKLINNTFRDTVFSFANEVALLCEQHNLNSFEVIGAANEGYPRNPIPLPSPGVGGICLSKDPYLYSHQWQQAGAQGRSVELRIGRLSREVNSSMPRYVAEKLLAFLERHNLRPQDARVLLVGVAFKGMPETSDIRCSPAMDLHQNLVAMGCGRAMAFDAVIEDAELSRLGLQPVRIEEGFKHANAVFFMNNHPSNTDFNLFRALQEGPRPLFFFDGWSAFSRIEVEAVPGVVYGTLGYTTPPMEEV